MEFSKWPGPGLGFKLTTLVIAFSAALLWAFSPIARGDDKTPTASFGLPQWGGNVRLPGYSLVTMSTTLRNPGAEESRLLLQAASAGGGQGNIINQREVLIGPNAQLRMQSRLLSHPGENYLAELLNLETGSLMEREEIASAYQTQAVRKRIFILNDDHDFPAASEMTQLDKLSERVQIGQRRGREAPEHWTDYGPSSIILIVKPDFNSMQDSQFEAIRDFVHGGGTLFFAHPKSVMRAARTPLADILPVDPMRVRRREQMPELTEWFKPYHAEDNSGNMEWPEGLPFLESVPHPNAHAPASQGDYPLIAYRPVGAGLSAIAAFDCSDPAFLISRRGLPLWNHVLSRSSPHPMTTGAVFAPPMERAADRLTGFQAADADTVQLILLTNLIFVCLIFMLFRMIRRPTAGWIFLGAYGTLLTGAIFYVANLQMEDQPDRSLISLELMNRQPDRRVGLQFISLFSQREAAPVISTNNADSAFMPVVPPNIDLNPIFTFRHRFRDTMQIRRDGNRERMPNFNLSAMRRRGLGCAFTFSQPFNREENRSQADLAHLVYSDSMPKLTGFHLPSDLPEDTQVFLTGAGGARRLSPADEEGTWETAAGPDSVFQLNPVYNRFHEFINGDWLPPEKLILLYPDSAERSPSPVNIEEDYYRNMYAVEMLPLKPRSETSEIAIPSFMIDIQPEDRPAQTLIWQEEDDYVQSAGSYIFSARLPPFLAELEIEEVNISVRLRNPDGRAVANVELLPFSAVLPKIAQDADITEDKAISAATEDRPQFVFDTSRTTDLTDPLTGRFYLRLTVKPETEGEGTPETAAATMRWRLSNIEAQVQGVR